MSWNSPDTLLTKIFIHSLLTELSERNILLTFVKLNLPVSHVCLMMEREEIERCTLLSEQLNTCLLGVRNWVCDLYHSGICFRKVECSCGRIMKSIQTLLNDEVCVGFVGARLLTHGIIDLFSGRSSRTGGSAVWEGSSGCIVCDTDSRTPGKTQSEFNLHKSRKTAHFWEEHTSVCFTFWQKTQNSHKMSLLKLPLPHKTEKMYEYVQVKIRLS